MSRHWTAAAVAAFTMISCGGDDDVNPDAAMSDAQRVVDAGAPDAQPALDLDDLCAIDGGYVDFFQRIVECNPDLAIQLGDLVTDESFSDACYGQFEDYYDDGSLTVADRGTWNICLDYIANVSCDVIAPDGPHPCRDVIVGLVALGGDCDVSEQCAGDAYCDLAALGPDQCGTCTTRSANGIGCSLHDECASFYCDAGTGLCAAQGDVGSICIDDDQCLGRLLCNGTTNQCTAPPTWVADDPCNSMSTDCGFPGTDLYCDESVNQCRRFLALGVTCGPATALCNLLEYQTCDEGDSNTCVVPVIVGEDAACGFLDGRECGTGLLCSNPFGGGTCWRPLTQGQDCSAAPNRCGFLLQCNGATCEFGDYSGMCPAP